MTSAGVPDPYRKAIEFLYELRWFGAKLGLENVRALNVRAGNPNQRLRFIHVAGTNGKGSTCAMLESIYRAAGLRVGLFTSPHLVSFRERIQVDREWISEKEVVRLVDRMKSLIAMAPESEHPTFFEVLTVMALKYFEERACDLVIWETGLGGRLDATNIVNPLASVITNIQLDHEKWLGNSLAEIAHEKAGIIKERTPIITGANEREAGAVIERIAAEKNAPLFRLDLEAARSLIGTTGMPLAGEHQLQNAALAVATAAALKSAIPVSTECIQTGLAAVQWPGRFQVLIRSSGHKVILDGAHNVAGAEALSAAVRQFCGPGRLTLVLGVLADKNYGGICRVLAPLADRILIVPIQSERTLPPEVLTVACRASNSAIPIETKSSLADALGATADDATVLITGSLYLVGEALELLEAHPGRSERALNEWGGNARVR